MSIPDRPFLCAIRDTWSGALIFLGAIADPVENSAPQPKWKR